MGWTRDQLAAARAAGRWYHVRRGFYAVPGSSADLVRAVRLGGRATAHSALPFHGVWRPSDNRLHVLVPSNGGRLRDPDVRALPLLDRGDVHVHWQDREPVKENLLGFRPVAGVATAVRQTVEDCDDVSAVAVLDSVLHLRLLDISQVRDLLPRERTRLLGDLDSRAESGLESVVRFRLRAVGFRMESQVVIPGVGRVDELVEGRLALELDGREHHLTEAAFEEDRRRDMELAARHYLHLRFTYKQAFGQWPTCLRAIASALDRRPSQPSPRPPYSGVPGGFQDDPTVSPACSGKSPENGGGGADNGRMRRGLGVVVLGIAVAALAGCSAGPSSPTSSSTHAPAGQTPEPAASTSRAVPRFAHVVIVVEENHGPAAAMGMPYLAQLRHDGMTFTDSHGVAHPSQPNYLALWSGSTHGVTSDVCPIDLGTTPSLGSQLLSTGSSVAAYAQGLPAAGSAACLGGAYARKHDPLADFAATAGSAHNLPFSAFPSDFGALPSVSFVVPDLDHDAHDGSIATADDWLRTELGGYAAWAPTNDSLLIVTFDEEDGGKAGNRILTVFSGAHVRTGASSEPIDHVRVLHTIESAFDLPLLGSHGAPITDVWQ
ncbi:alkaline phosphatase family protein [Amnibacterium sp.]|uniref:alkaline phosphatase family protein n=1 Tax=Amnibacterium sp. TaxID=1872496 RepID=UPI002628199C|nr:alkaline phosphatase family protein [Amnibacterium sp.]